MAETIDELARRALTGDGNNVAWRALFDALTPRLYGHFRRLGCTVADGTELVQETWLRIVENHEKYDPTRPFEPFLFTVATRLWIDGRRQRRLAVDSAAVPDDVAAIAPLPVDLLVAAEQTERMRHCLDVLGESEREMIVMRFWHGMSMDQLGRRLGMPVTSVKGKCFRAVRKLADCMHLEESEHFPVSSASAAADCP
jgi:RNA polymerase sigma-70 factor (ECF subfamily)